MTALVRLAQFCTHVDLKRLPDLAEIVSAARWATNPGREKRSWENWRSAMSPAFMSMDY